MDVNKCINCEQQQLYRYCQPAQSDWHMAKELYLFYLYCPYKFLGLCHVDLCEASLESILC